LGIIALGLGDFISEDNDMIEISLGLTFEIDTCSCGGTFALPSNFFRQARDLKKSWHCPYCRERRSYSENEADRLKRELAAKERELKLRGDSLAAERARHDQTREALRQEGLRLSAQRGATTRIKNRVSKGVCPCCQRHFTDLQRHMAGKHPGYAATEAT
jgi:hypothetical protein